jgi:hypothetical protein
MDSYKQGSAQDLKISVLSWGRTGRQGQVLPTPGYKHISDFWTNKPRFLDKQETKFDKTHVGDLHRLFSYTFMWVLNVVLVYLDRRYILIETPELGSKYGFSDDAGVIFYNILQNSLRWSGNQLFC